MIHLINGNGQLGEALRASIKKIQATEDVYIYHTWNIDKKDWDSQEAEYNKFVEFVKVNKKSRIIFISTASNTDSWYTHYKQLAEAHLLQNSNQALVVRLPILIGKGPVRNFTEPTCKAFGIMEICSLEEACAYILDKVGYNGLVKCHTLAGERVTATTVKEIVLQTNNYKEFI